MQLQNRIFVQDMFFLFNEKACFHYTYMYNDKSFLKLFMRFNFNVICYSDINLLYFFFLSFPILSNNISIINNNNRYFFCCNLFCRSIYNMLSFVFFSYFYSYSGSNSFYFWFNRYRLFHSNSVGFSFESKLISFFGFFDDYFYGVVDADYKFLLQISIQFNFFFGNSLLLSLFYSLFCFPFVNKK